MSTTVYYIIGSIVFLGIGYAAYRRAYIPWKGRRTKVEDIARVLRELKPSVSYFKGYMNSLWQISQHYEPSFARLTFDGLQKVINLRCTPYVQEWYTDLTRQRNNWGAKGYKLHADVLINIFKDCGVHQQQEELCHWRADYIDRYQIQCKLEEDSPCRVIAPYWMYEDKIYERGLVGPAEA